METKHSPSPWHSENWAIITCDGEHIASVNEPFEGGDEQQDAAILEVATADLQLMTAAPELLEACRAILSANWNRLDDIDEAIGLARAAIAKATTTPAHA
jgi:hypothetical protein